MKQKELDKLTSKYYKNTLSVVEKTRQIKYIQSEIDLLLQEIEDTEVRIEYSEAIKAGQVS